MMKSGILIFLFMTVSMNSCRNESVQDIPAGKPGKGDMEELNRYLVRKDRERILNYIERKGFEMQESPTGLWYQVKKSGEGEFLNSDTKIIIEYDCYLLDGTICYSSDELGPKEIVLGRTGIEPGLYEGLRLLRPGAEAVFILPPFLAHGLPGDGNKIPPRSVIVYEVKVLGTDKYDKE